METGKGARRGLSALSVKALGEQRDESRFEGAFGKQPAKQVGNAESHEEGIGHRPRAKDRGDQNIADEAEHAAPDGHRPDGGEGAVKGHLAWR